MTGTSRLIASIDDSLGDALEATVRRHHRRRLTRVGWGSILDPPPGRWSRRAGPPSTGNAVEILLDGEQALTRIAQALRTAERRVMLAGWFFTATFLLERDPAVELREALVAVAARADVYVLAWAGAPFRLFKPDRQAVRAELAALGAHPRIRVAADRHERPMHCHHEKLVVIDDRLAFVGGIDLTSLGGDRLDSSAHRPRGAIGWHDSSAELQGPAVATVSEHFRLRWHAVTGERLTAADAPPPAGDVELQVVRTVPEHIYRELDRGEFTIAEAYLSALRAAQRFVYIENQFLWSSEVVRILADKLRHPPCDEFRVLLVLPVHPNNGGDDTRGQLGVLLDADAAAGGGRVLACTVYAGGSEPERVYVHSKITLIDDAWMTIGSANLNEHSLFNDTEMNLVLGDSPIAGQTRKRLFAEHLEVSEAEASAPPHRLIDERWRPIADEQLARLQRGDPLTHRLVALPRISRRSKRLLGPLQSLIVDG